MTNQKNKRFAALRNGASPRNGDDYDSRQEGVLPSAMSSSEATTSTGPHSEEDEYGNNGSATPIPSLHGNLVKNRFWRDPLE
jgi:hypothetical protein